MLLGESPATENGNPVENHSSTLRPFCAEVKRAICSRAERVVEMRVSREKFSDSRSKRETSSTDRSPEKMGASTIGDLHLPGDATFPGLSQPRQLPLDCVEPGAKGPQFAGIPVQCRHALTRSNVDTPAVGISMT